MRRLLRARVTCVPAVLSAPESGTHRHRMSSAPAAAPGVVIAVPHGLD